MTTCGGAGLGKEGEVRGQTGGGHLDVSGAIRPPHHHEVISRPGALHIRGLQYLYQSSH